MSTRLSILLAAASVSISAAIRVGENAPAAYKAFQSEFGVQRNHEGPAEFQVRVALFERRREEVRKHNAQPNPSWLAVVNKFSDYSESEFQAMLGHRHSQRGRAVGASPGHVVSLLESMPQKNLAQTVDWRSKLNISKTAKDQGACGSCWAVAAAGALETHAEMGGDNAPEVSYEELVDCVQNPHECGGSGGCKGATAELAFDYISKHGLGRKQDYHGYQSHGDGTCKPPSNRAITAQSFVRLPTNEQKPLEAAVAEHGPAVVSADGSSWASYGSGVFQGCQKDAVINHAILMMGYGTDKASKHDYWLIRNSWGPDWGEGGYIRLLRHKDTDKYCGVDHKPLEGVGCKGGPPTLPVCGMCGVLSDSAYPTGVALSSTTHKII